MIVMITIGIGAILIMADIALTILTILTIIK